MTMNEAFHPLLDKGVIVYLDDILIYGIDRAQHLRDIEAVLKILNKNRLLTKASKWKGYRLVVLGGYRRTDPLLNKPFNPNGLVVGILTWRTDPLLTKPFYPNGLVVGILTRLEFFGHVVSADGVEIDQKKIATIQAWHELTKLTELQSFWGFVNYVRWFVPDMAQLTTPRLT
ncbi:unnamed protein product [Closterium sp. NIES-54]